MSRLTNKEADVKQDLALIEQFLDAFGWSAIWRRIRSAPTVAI
jgi:hypothetical protein